MFVARLDPVSTSADWEETFEIADMETGDLLDLTGSTITLSLHHERRCNSDRFYDYAPQRSDLVASTSTGEITIPDIGYFTVSYLKSQNGAFSGLVRGNYDVAIKVERDGYTTELVVGTLPVMGTYR